MDVLFENYFDRELCGKSYQSEQDYMRDIYNFVDMCIGSMKLMMFQCIDGVTLDVDEKQRYHIPEISGGLEEAYASVLRQNEETNPQQRLFVRQKLEMARRYIKERLVYTPYQGKMYRMRALAEKLQLSKLEEFMLWLSYANSYDEKYQQIFGYIQGHKELTHPTIQFTCYLYSLFADLGENEPVHLMERRSILFDFFDVRNGLGGKPKTIGYEADRRLIGYIEGFDCLDDSLRLYATYVSQKEEKREFFVREEIAGQVDNVMSQMNSDIIKKKDCEGRYTSSVTNILHIYGPPGNGKRMYVREAARNQDRGVIFVDIGKVEQQGLGDIEYCAKKLFMESVLLNACICVIDKVNRDEFVEQEDHGEKNAPSQKLLLFRDILQSKVSFLLWLGVTKCTYLMSQSASVISIENPMLTVGERIRLWEKMSLAYKVDKNLDWVLCANQYILSAKGIHDTLETANLNRMMRKHEVIEEADIRYSVKELSPNQLGRYATRIPAVYTWDDLVVSPEQKHQMQMICNQIKYRSVVGEEWGFFKKTAYGRGVCALFYGSPGTGKTMSVQVMANELGLDLYRVELSQMVSKYIGETEKNISALFQKAKNINALLFFDEADSLFAKRSEVKDSKDRNANAETAHLLQKLEDYDGITILATNYVNNIDDAFKRRIKFMVNFTFPTPEVRLRLWNGILPAAVPREEELDFEYYARNFELSGSSIKEILTNAAFIAASEGAGLANRHIIEAIKVNFAKYGKILSDEDFGYLIV